MWCDSSLDNTLLIGIFKYLHQSNKSKLLMGICLLNLGFTIECLREGRF